MKTKSNKTCSCEDIPDNTVHKIAAIVISNKKVLVVCEKDKNIFNNPGGKHEKNESLIDCLHREVKEELGVSVKNARYFGRFFGTTIKSKPLVIDAFLTELSNNPQITVEVAKYLWVDLHDSVKVELSSVFKKQILSELVNKSFI